MISTNPRTHILELTKDREIPITEKQYKAIKAMQKIDKYNDPFEIRDPDTGKMLHDGLMKDILGFREIERQDTSGMRYICDFATRHTMNESCDCPAKYGIFPIQFKQKLWELYPNKYPSTITEQEKQIILKSLISKL